MFKHWNNNCAGRLKWQTKLVKQETFDECGQSVTVFGQVGGRE